MKAKELKELGVEELKAKLAEQRQAYRYRGQRQERQDHRRSR